MNSKLTEEGAAAAADDDDDDEVKKNHELRSWSPVPYNIAISCIT